MVDYILIFLLIVYAVFVTRYNIKYYLDLRNSYREHVKKFNKKLEEQNTINENTQKNFETINENFKETHKHIKQLNAKTTKLSQDQQQSTEITQLDRKFRSQHVLPASQSKGVEAKRIRKNANTNTKKGNKRFSKSFRKSDT